MCSIVTAYKLNNCLMAAIHADDYEAVLKCLMQGAKATIISKYGGHTAVGLAAMIGNTEILKLLIQSCTEDFDIFRRTGKSSVEIELDSTPDGMDKLEWEDEFEMNSSETDDEPADENISLYFYYAKTLESMSIVASDFNTENTNNNSNNNNNILMRQDPHALDDMQMSPLHYAAAFGNVENARLLIQHGALIDVINTNGFTPLHLGVKSPQITELLLDMGANPNMKTFGTGMTPLHYAITSEPISAKLLLYNKSTDLNATDHIEHTPLMVAVVHDCTEIAQMLVEQGAHVNVQDNDGNCALKYAIIANKLQLAEFLLNHGARRLPTHNLLHECVQYNYTEMANLLLQHGEHLHKRNQLGHTPIMTAIRFKKFEVLEFLLKEQAKQQQEQEEANFQHELQVAVDFIKNLQDFKTIARLLFMHSKGACATTWLESSKWPEFTSAIISNCRTMSYCATPLSLAIIMQKNDIAEFLIKEGADVHLICHDHVINALRMVNSTGYAELARLLVVNGFKYPIYKAPFPYYWTPKRLQFERDMLELCNKPLNLQALARLTVRSHLRHKLNTSAVARKKYCATQSESSLSLMIGQLGVPNMLIKYLTQFTDCPPISLELENTQYSIIDNFK